MLPNIHICNKKYRELYDINGTASTPGFWKSPKECSSSLPRYTTSELQSMVGALLYLGLHTRPDILFATTYLARNIHSATDLTDMEARRVFEYLNNTSNVTLKLDCSDISSIRAFADANWAGSELSRRSVSGTMIFLGKSPISWSSKGQKCAALSTMESELIALTLACQDALWLRNLLSELLLDTKLPITLYSDNQPCLSSHQTCPMTPWLDTLPCVTISSVS